MSVRKILILLIIALFSVSYVSATPNGQYSDWTKTKEVTVTDNSGISIADYPVIVENIDMEGYSTDSIRVSDSQDNSLDYAFRTNGDGTVDITFQPDLTANSEELYYIFFGNDQASDQSSSWNNVRYNVYDDFEDGDLDLNTWNRICGSYGSLGPCTYEESNGVLEFYADSSYNTDRPFITTEENFKHFKIDYDSKLVEGTASQSWLMTRWNNEVGGTYANVPDYALYSRFTQNFRGAIAEGGSTSNFWNVDISPGSSYFDVTAEVYGEDSNTNFEIQSFGQTQSATTEFNTQSTSTVGFGGRERTEAVIVDNVKIRRYIEPGPSITVRDISVEAPSLTLLSPVSGSATNNPLKFEFQPTCNTDRCSGSNLELESQSSSKKSSSSSEFNGVYEGFERENPLSSYTSNDGSFSIVSGSNSYSGNSLYSDGGIGNGIGDPLILDDSAIKTPERGDSFSFRYRFGDDYLSRFIFGAQESDSSPGGYYINVDGGGGNRFTLRARDTQGNILASDTASLNGYNADQGYALVKIDWKESGEITADLYQADGSTQVASVSITDSTHDQGKIGFSSDDRCSGCNYYWDNIKIQGDLPDSGVYSFESGFNNFNVNEDSSKQPGAITLERSTAHAYKGSYSVHMDTEGNEGSGNIKRTFTDFKDEISIWFYLENGNSYGNCNNQIFDGSGTRVYNTDLRNSEQGAWEEHTYDVSSYDEITVQSGCQTGAAARESGYWDFFDIKQPETFSVDSLSTTPGQGSWGLDDNIDIEASVSNSPSTVTATVVKNGQEILTDAALTQESSGNYVLQNAFTADKYGDYKVSVRASSSNGIYDQESSTYSLSTSYVDVPFEGPDKINQVSLVSESSSTSGGQTVESFESGTFGDFSVRGENGGQTIEVRQDSSNAYDGDYYVYGNQNGDSNNFYIRKQFSENQQVESLGVAVEGLGTDRFTDIYVNPRDDQSNALTQIDFACKDNQIIISGNTVGDCNGYKYVELADIDYSTGTIGDVLVNGQSEASDVPLDNSVGISELDVVWTGAGGTEARVDYVTYSLPANPPNIDTFDFNTGSWSLGDSIDVEASVSNSPSTVTATVVKNGDEVISGSTMTGDGSGNFVLTDAFTVDEKGSYEIEVEASNSDGESSSLTKKFQVETGAVSGESNILTYNVEDRVFESNDEGWKPESQDGVVIKDGSLQAVSDEVDSFEYGTDGNAIEGNNEWGGVDSYSSNLVFDNQYSVDGDLSLYTGYDSGFDNGPLIKRQVFEEPKKPDKFVSSYRETIDSQSHSISLRNKNDERMFGYGSNNPQFQIADPNGWTGEQCSSNYDTWYTVTLDFDWEQETFEVTRSDGCNAGTYDIPSGSEGIQYIAVENGAGAWDQNNQDGIDAHMDDFRFEFANSGSGSYTEEPVVVGGGSVNKVEIDASTIEADDSTVTVEALDSSKNVVSSNTYSISDGVQTFEPGFTGAKYVQLSFDLDPNTAVHDYNIDYSKDPVNKEYNYRLSVTQEGGLTTSKEDSFVYSNSKAPIAENLNTTPVDLSYGDSVDLNVSAYTPQGVDRSIDTVNAEVIEGGEVVGSTQLSDSNGDDVYTASDVFQADTANVDYNIQVIVTDTEGTTTSVSKTKSFTDNTAPQIKVQEITESNSPIAQDYIYAKAEITDNNDLSTTQFNVNGQAYSMIEASGTDMYEYNLTGLSSGEYTYSVSAQDIGGNTVSSNEYSSTLDIQHPSISNPFIWSGKTWFVDDNRGTASYTGANDGRHSMVFQAKKDYTGRVRARNMDSNGLFSGTSQIYRVDGSNYDNELETLADVTYDFPSDNLIDYPVVTFEEGEYYKFEKNYNDQGWDYDAPYNGEVLEKVGSGHGGQYPGRYDYGFSRIELEEKQEVTDSDSFKDGDKFNVEADVTDNLALSEKYLDARVFGAGNITLSQLSGDRYSAEVVVDASEAAPSGTYFANIYASDTAGNEDSLEASQGITTITSTKPDVEMVYPAGNQDAVSPIGFDFVPKCYSSGGCESAEVSFQVKQAWEDELPENAGEWHTVDTFDQPENNTELTAFEDFTFVTEFPYNVDWRVEIEQSDTQTNTVNDEFDLVRATLYERAASSTLSSLDNIGGRRFDGGRNVEELLTGIDYVRTAILKTIEVDAVTTDIQSNVANELVPFIGVSSVADTSTDVVRPMFLSDRSVVQQVSGFSLADPSYRPIRDISGDSTNLNSEVSSPVYIFFESIDPENSLAQDSALRAFFEGTRQVSSNPVSSDTVDRIIDADRTRFAEEVINDDVQWLGYNSLVSDFVDTDSTSSALYTIFEYAGAENTDTQDEAVRGQAFFERNFDEAMNVPFEMARILEITREQGVEEVTVNERTTIGQYKVADAQALLGDQIDGLLINFRTPEDSTETNDVMNRAQFLAERSFGEESPSIDNSFRTLEAVRPLSRQETMLDDRQIVGFFGFAGSEEVTLEESFRYAFINYRLADDELLQTNDVFERSQLIAERIASGESPANIELDRSFEGQRIINTEVFVEDKTLGSIVVEVLDTVAVNDEATGYINLVVPLEDQNTQVVDSAERLGFIVERTVNQDISGESFVDRGFEGFRTITAEQVTSDESIDVAKIFVDDFNQVLETEMSTAATAFFEDTVETRMETVTNLQELTGLFQDFTELLDFEESTDRAVTVPQSLSSNLITAMDVMIQYSISDDVEGDVAQETQIVTTQEDEVVIQPMMADATTGQFFASEVRTNTGQATLGLGMVLALIGIMARGWWKHRKFKRMKRVLNNSNASEQKKKKARAYINAMN